MRDQTLAAVLEAQVAPQMENGYFHGGRQTHVVWSADGQYLTASDGPDNAMLSIYTCATGKLVGTVSTAPFIAQIPPNKRDPNNANVNVSVDVFLWSSRVQRLLAVDTADGVGIILEPIIRPGRSLLACALRSLLPRRIHS